MSSDLFDLSDLIGALAIGSGTPPPLLFVGEQSASDVVTKECM